MKRFPAQYKEIFSLFRKFPGPLDIQDFLDTFRINFKNSTRSPFFVLKEKKMHCLEGALLAMAICWYHNKKAFLLDLKTNGKDQDHVIVVFKENGLWGAISKTNHAVLRYRDPVYKTIRELVMSYFNEYINTKGEKVLVSFSKPMSLEKYGNEWLVSKKNLDYIGDDLDFSPHTPIMRTKARLRRGDKIEREMGNMREWKKK